MLLIEPSLSRGFPLRSLALKEIATLLGGALVGADRPVEYLGLLRTERGDRRNFLSYVDTRSYLYAFLQSDKEAAIATKSVFSNIDLPPDKSVVVVERQASAAFFELNETLIRMERYPKLTPFRGANCSIHPSAVIYDHVFIADNVTVDANAVVYPNSVIRPDVHLKAGAVIGGGGFFSRNLFGKHRKTTHPGGAYLSENVEVGSGACIDRDMLGDFTRIGANTKIDNLVYVAHCAKIGSDCSLVGLAQISGSSVIGNHVWLGPHTCVNQEIRIGDHVYAGSGSIVVEDVPAHALIYGCPAKVRAHICECYQKLAFSEERASCESCGASFRKTEMGIRRDK